jgi:hypothetical protein
VTTINEQVWVIAAVVILLIAAAGWFFYRKRQTHRLQKRFGPEYGRTMGELGSRAKTESELSAREKRVERLKILPLAPAEAARLSQAWKVLQGRFVDNPQGVVVEADNLVRELMLKRGYPMADFEGRAADISVHHPMVVENYRAAQAIALLDARGQATTEDLRRAVVHYRALFDDLLEVRAPAQTVTPTREMELRS